jgi:replication-associated recombination protein RarA
MNYKPILKKTLASKNTPNLILYGHHKINKEEILNEYLDIKSCNEMTKYDINYHSNQFFKIFNMNNIKRSKINNFFSLIFEILQCKNYYIEKNRILILKNFNHIDKSIQDRFRVIFEKYRINTLFILTTDYYNSILNPIKSRFLSIRIRDLSRADKISISYPVIKNLTYDKRIKIYDKIYEYNDKNIILNFSKNNYGLINNRKDLIENIYHSLKNMKFLDLSKIKDYAYNLEKYHLNNFHSDFLKLIIDEFHNIKLKECIFKISDIEYNYKKSFNRILSNEFLLIFIYESLEDLNLTRREEIYRNKEK